MHIAINFANFAKASGVDGIVCSPQYLKTINRIENLADLIKVTPAIRPLWASSNDQKCIMTPAEAIKAGADYLIIGRPITQPPKKIGNPVKAVERIIKEIEAVL